MNVMKLLAVLLFIALVTKGFLIYGEAEAESKAVKVAALEQYVNVYSSRKEGLVQHLFNQFTAQTNIKVNFVTDKAGKLISRLKTEGAYSPADLFLTADVGNLAYAADLGLLQEIDSKVLNQNIGEKFRDPAKKWYGLSQRVRAIFYAKDRVNPAQLSTYEDMADEKWKGKILIRSSSNVYNQSLIASLIEANGLEETEKWAAGLVANFARKPQGGDRDQIKAVAAGQGDIAIANSYYYGKMLTSSNQTEREAANKVAIFFPNQDNRGAHANISGGGVLVSAKNKENAIKLLEYLSGKKAQKIYADINYEYPIAQDVAISKIVEDWGEFKSDNLPVNSITKYRDEILKLSDRVGWR